MVQSHICPAAVSRFACILSRKHWLISNPVCFRSAGDEVAENACGRRGRQFGAPAGPAGCLNTRIFHSHFYCSAARGRAHRQVYYADSPSSTFYDWIRTCPEKRRRKTPALKSRVWPCLAGQIKRRLEDKSIARVFVRLISASVLLLSFYVSPMHPRHKSRAVKLLCVCRPWGWVQPAQCNCCVSIIYRPAAEGATPAALLHLWCGFWSKDSSERDQAAEQE